MQLTDLNSWRFNQVRVSLFSPEVLKISPGEIFLALFQTQATQVTEQPMVGTYQAFGDWNEAQVMIQVAINRLDCVITPKITQQSDIPQPFFFTNTEDCFNNFRSKTKELFNNVTQPINRIGVGVNSFLPAHDGKASYRDLERFIRMVKFDVERFRDLNFQINLKTNFQSIEVNRLSKWNSIILQAVGETGLSISKQHYSGCELDINTDVSHTQNLELPMDILNFLYNEAQSILVDGIE